MRHDPNQPVGLKMPFLKVVPSPYSTTSGSAQNLKKTEESSAKNKSSDKDFTKKILNNYEVAGK